MSSITHTNTPQLAVSDSRGLPVRSVQFYRGADGQPVDARVTQHYFDKAGRLIASRDPRFSSRLKYGVCAPVNLMQIVSLSGALLLSKSVDSGWRVSLNGEAGQLVDSCDGRDNPRQIEYDGLLRPLAINESGRMTERFTYGGPATAEHNQCNQLIRHDDTAGSRLLRDYGLSGRALSEKRYFLQSPDSPDWPLAEPDRDALLEPVGLQTRWAFNAQGEDLAQTDANGNVQRFSHGVAGQLHAVELTLANTAQRQTLVSAIHYDAFNQAEQETAGNGVVSRYVYDQQDGRLTELSALSADGSVLQKLNYSYDPAGNVLLINDASQPDRYCGNQRIEPINRYCYDTLYQLIEATGREIRHGASHGPALPGLQPLPTLDPCQVSNYTQRYSYDAAGNLLQMRHEGAHNFTRNMHVAPDSNRSLPDDDGDVDFATSFDANGNLLQLVRGQVMGWDARNQLQHITTVQRKDAPNDDERYIYDGQGQRCRKISTAQASGRTLTDEVRYLPGLEIRTTADGETLHVVTAQAGRNRVRVLHWEAGKPGAIANDQVRYSLGDHLGSSTLELDQQGGLISQESYYPFGGTAWWAARSAVKAKYKTVRYSGKERDASGLYYYGFRYYAPWLQRWINPDPAGDVDGLNLYRFVGNAPVLMVDNTGLFGERSNAAKQAAEASKLHFDTYLQPRIMERRERDKESAIESLKKRTGATSSGSVGELLEAVSGVLETAPMTFNIQPEKLGRLKGEGMINRWHTLTHEDSWTRRRDKFENLMFKYGDSSSELVRRAALTGAQENKGTLRPLYGALQVDRHSGAGGAPSHGSAAFHLSDQARSYMTFTGADSLCSKVSLDVLASSGNVFPLVTSMLPCTWEALTQGLGKNDNAEPGSGSSSYIEWQSHAPVKWRDMKFLKFEKFSDLDTARSDPSTVAFFKKHAVPVRLYSM
ncbi:MULTISPECIES: RHS repeat-associated core domain-containing protein [Pseudomonas syringae group]|uniref:Insecticidal toxin complex protein C1 n=3 Tax=Pseudomonas syringae group TaxID=136849 RepID=A0AAW4DVU0_PSESX|nr:MULTISPECIES: RHS repeat-associated core domain-containing protein [Pseudomonas syringae group]AVI86366.1 insecticidal toxin complex protein C1 [Pseudomonas syringae pv. tomato]EEB58529.1 insecticidal toxin protein [Pseudomonas syringae pv. tomato T1]KGK93695.1 insecticidal toxin complex protein C1 [Pseudomonas syringae pv. tomato]KUR43955.1 putative deoxyribonuclease RhsA [Pseudomonas syringae pv. tomato]KUR51299.1 putative deoxyribonuclease RhsA [Pseudomonas syringae pv. tomato]